MKKITFCVNCGKYGHTTKVCFEPITSYGVILFYRDGNINNSNFNINSVNEKNHKIKYLLVRRRDSHNYVEFLIGKYDINNISFLNTMFSEMTINERNNILTKDFDNLWNNLWGEKNKKKNKLGYNESYNKYNILKNGFYHPSGELINLEILCKNNNCVFKEPEWGFPKGKRNYKEKNINVALREFTEETGIDSSKINIISQINPITETFLASNNKYYKHIYYVASINNLIDVKVDNNNKLQIKEIGDIGWFESNEVNSILRNSDIEKKKIFNKLNLFLQNFFFKDEIKI
jgi:ADP-ribose pyrophosphatase YjhB (NUDIX family)